jgi:hypothetical protein
MAGIETDEKCPHCGAPVRWRLSVLGTRLRLDADPNPDGNVIIVEVDGKVRVDVLGGDRMPAQQEAYKQHACPKPRRAPRCQVCRFAMTPAEFFLRTGRTVHPGCDPEHGAEVARIQAGIKEAP